MVMMMVMVFGVDSLTPDGRYPRLLRLRRTGAEAELEKEPGLPREGGLRDAQAYGKRVGAGDRGDLADARRPWPS